MTNERTVWRISLGGFLVFWVLGLLLGALSDAEELRAAAPDHSRPGDGKGQQHADLLDGIMQATYLLARLSIDDATGEVVSFSVLRKV